MRKELKEKIADIIRAERNTFMNSSEIADDVIAVIDQDQKATISSTSHDSALANFNKLEAAIKTQLALIDEIKAVLNPQPTKVEEVRSGSLSRS